jgi:hypothetical protein
MTLFPALLCLGKPQFVLQEAQDILVGLAKHFRSGAYEGEIDGLSSRWDASVDLVERALDSFGGGEADPEANCAASNSERDPEEEGEDGQEKQLKKHTLKEAHDDGIACTTPIMSFTSEDWGRTEELKRAFGGSDVAGEILQSSLGCDGIASVQQE